MERVRERAAVPREYRQLVDGERRLSPPRLRRPADDADDVAEMDVDVADAPGVAHELDAPRAVDEVEEDELPHLAPRHDAPSEAPRFLELTAGLDLVGRCAYVDDGVAIGEPLGSRHGGQPIRPRAASQSGMIQRTQQRFRVNRAVTTSPCSRPS